MAKPPNKNPAEAPPRIPFDDAIRQILRAPPKHKVAKKAKKKTGS
jgi:hypothetical protein